VLLFIGVTSSFMAGSCQGDRTQGARMSSKNCEKYNCITHCVARYLHSYRDTRADVDCHVLLLGASARATAEERGNYADMRG
jgi:hypothetical protein